MTTPFRKKIEIILATKEKFSLTSLMNDADAAARGQDYVYKEKHKLDSKQI